MLEKDIENLIAKNPDEIFPGEGFVLVGQQIVVEGRRLDILFEDIHKRRIIVEVKRGILTREASGQIAEYYGLLKNKNKDMIYELVLCANIIPKERRTFLESIGIECKELGIAQISELARKCNYTFIDDQTSYIKNKTKNIYESNIEEEYIESNEVSVWIFQANPNRYDILNSLNDDEIGNSIHWLVNQHKMDIHKGHLALIWMSGSEAGIYAIARIETEPTMIKENPLEIKYWIDDYEDKLCLRVKMTVVKRLINKPILKNKLIKNPKLAKLSILRQFQGTNFPVHDLEWNEIAKLI